jgi:hypothetical protein
MSYQETSRNAAATDMAGAAHTCSSPRKSQTLGRGHAGETGRFPRGATEAAGRAAARER